MTQLSIVIVSFNTRGDLEACLRSLADAPPAAPHEIIVVDNASADDSVDAARAFTGVQVIPLERNVGFAAANNVGIRASTGKLLLLLNSDTIVPGGALDALIARLDANPRAAVAGPRLVDGRGHPELSFGRMISPLNEYRQKRIGARYRAGRPRTVAWIQRETMREQAVDWVSGACLLVRRGDAEAAGLLDERYFIYMEDVDFCASIRARDRQVLFTPAAQVTHLRGRSRATAPGMVTAAYRRSHIAFYEKHHPFWAATLKIYLRLKGEL
jgi:N-acetylglucosaminyl-diphospho-decaprenol L-rhamnosyltransferase